jgi:hypothetical protein
VIVITTECFHMTRVKIPAVAHDQVDPMLDLLGILNIIDRRQKPLVATRAGPFARPAQALNFHSRPP